MSYFFLVSFLISMLSGAGFFLDARQLRQTSIRQQQTSSERQVYTVNVSAGRVGPMCCNPGAPPPPPPGGGD